MIIIAEYQLDKQGEALSMLAKTLFWAVMIGHGVGIVITACLVGTFMPEQSATSISGTMMILFVAAVVQIAAFYKLASESMEPRRWMIANIMAVVSFIGTMCFWGGDYISAMDLFLTLTFAITSCGMLIWLRLTPPSS